MGAPAESRRRRLPAIDRLPRTPTSLIAGIAGFLAGYVFLFPSGCADVEGVPSWERCATVLGTPAFSLTDWGLDNTFDILIPLVVGILAGALTWRLLRSDRS